MSLRPTAQVVALIVGVACLGCAIGTEDERPLVAPATPPSPTPPVAPAPSECTDRCLLLLAHDSKELERGAYCELCGGDDASACDLGFALSRMTCDDMDYVRNCMYARLGYTFSGDDAWRAVFDQEDWYEPRASFRWSDVDRVQVRNAKRLKAASETRRCAR